MSDRGSIWRKWDFHVHTPASFHWKGGKRLSAMSPSERDDSLRQLVKVMNESDVSVFVFMDYWTFDGYLALVDFLKTNVDVKLYKTVFPGIELRCDSPGDFRLNIHVVLSNELTRQQLEDFKQELVLNLTGRSLSDEALAEVASRLQDDKLEVHGISREDLRDQEKAKQAGATVAVVKRDSVFKAVESVPDRQALLFVPWDTNDGALALKWKEHSVEVTEFLEKAHIFEARKPLYIDVICGRKTNENGKFFDSFQQTIRGPKPAVSGSDAHKFSDYGKFPIGEEGERCTWVKADCTFKGLRQLLNEPAGRICVGSTPTKLEDVASNRTKYIDKVAVKKVEGSDFAEHWFDCEIPLNPDLVAVIGNKGSGKSALADIIGLLGDSKKGQHFAFLNSAKFRNTKSNKARHFEGTLTWVDQEKSQKPLDRLVNPETVKRVKYIPQNYLEDVCNELTAGDGGVFDKELKAVIFSHVPAEHRLNAESLDELLRKYESNSEKARRIHKGHISEANRQIIEYERQMRPGYRAEVESKLSLKRQELEALSEKPAEIKPVDQDEAAQKLAAAAAEEIEVIKSGIVKFEKEIGSLNLEKKEIALSRERVSTIRSIVTNLQKEYWSSAERASDLLRETLQVPFDTLVTFKADLSLVDDFEFKLSERRTAIESALDEQQPGSLAANAVEARFKLKLAQDKLAGPAKAYQEYLRNIEDWQKKRAAIVGDKDTPNTIAYYEQQLRNIQELPSILNVLKEKRNEGIRAVYEETKVLADRYKGLYSPVQEFTSNHPLIAQQFKLVFDVTISANRFEAGFLEQLNRGAAGSFSGIDDGAAVVHSLLQETDFTDVESVLRLVNGVFDRLHSDYRKDGRPNTAVENQLRKGVEVLDLYNYISSLDYLSPQYTLMLGDKPLYQLSPGERGALLLIFYLLVDRGDIPLVIDQPEENLDNQTVFRILGECIKEAKKRRQVIIVTHNPNLAVACDAEQVIVASLDAMNGNKVTYSFGSLESPEINRRVIDILEGTWPAFANRDSKYFAIHS